MALTTETPRSYQIGDYEEYPVAASAKIFEGAAVGENGSGYARPLEAGDRFLGFADRTADNSTGGAGAIRVKVRARGRVQLAVASLAITDNDRVAVYASDDGTFVKTKASNSYVGRVSRFVSSGVGVVEFDAFNPPTIITALTDSTTGTANDTVADVGASFNQATLNSNFADLTAKINALIAATA